MDAVRRTLSTAALAGLLVLAPTAAFAATPTPTPDPSATASASPAASPTPAPIPSETTAPAPSDSATPASGCEQNPEICQSGGAPGGTTTDCGQIGPGGEPASPPPPGVVCIAGGLRPGTTGTGTSGNGAGVPELPRTGAAPLLPAVTVGMWLVLLGVVLALAGRRRTA